MSTRGRTARRLRAALAGAALLAGACRQSPPPPVARPGRLSVAELLGSSRSAGFARAVGIREFEFPGDHGPHPEFRTEWWYFTGNLHGSRGREFGYQLTFFRSALAPRARERSSRWAGNQTWMAHFAVTDISARRFHAFERFGRGALGLAGAQSGPLRVWLEDWSAEGGGVGEPFLRLRARQNGVAIALELERGKPPVLQGDRGLSQKGDEPGNASYYYSLTRMPTRGSVEVDGRSIGVEGTSWMDREWSTSALEEGVAGWDWFSLRLDDDRELMYYQLRRDDGTAHPLSTGSLVEPDGSKLPIQAAEVRLDVLDTWTTADGVTYPGRWRLELPGHGVAVEIVPALESQELRHSFRYWEGAVRARGERAGRPLAGAGYVELTGYAEAAGAGSGG